MRPLLPLLLATAACHSPPAHDMPDAPSPGDTGSDASTACAAGLAGAACVLDLYDRASAGCDAAAVASLRGELDARAKLGPLWAGQRALFRTAAPAHVAGDWNGWAASAPATAPLCGSDLIVLVAPVPSGFHTYKLVDDAGAWTLDPQNPAFAYDDYAGNADGRNSVLDTPDSGRGHLVELDQACSAALGNCRAVTAYLPPGYDAPEAAQRRYPVLFMHDGQNVWDDHTCCFGHTGWEINVTLDAEIAAGKVAPIVVIAADNSPNRNNEYGLDPALMTTFLQFQVGELQPHALDQVRGDGQRVFVAGSSLGGLVSMELGLRYPQTYAGVASLSGAFWPGLDTHTALLDQIPTLGKQAVAVYVDSGGDPADNSDGAQDTIDVRDALVTLGWVRGDSTACTVGADGLCYYLEPGATHDELAWKARAWRFLEFLFPR
ncbi:MAG: alpha/beta hydrolase-fold protein [Acidobacteriota bacterium]